MRSAAKKWKKNKDKVEVSMRMMTLQTCSAGEREKENKLTKEIVGVGAVFFFFGNSLLRNL